MSEGRIARFLPIAGWLPSYDRRSLRGDLAAGAAVTALVVPKNLGYAGIAGVPLQNGLYAVAVGGIVYALFATSRHISTGPSSGLAAVAGAAVLTTGVEGDQAAELVAAITLATGLLFLLFALFRLGWIARFLSKAVITGFLAGAAVDVVIGELPKLTGTDADGDNAWRELGSWIGSLGDTHGTTLLVGAGSLALILAVRFLLPAVPGALVVVTAGLVVSYLFDLGAHDVELVGDVPSGLPSPQIPDLTLVGDHYATVGIAAGALLLIGFSQTAGDARAFAARHHYRIDVDQESVAQGMANSAAGIFQGMPVTTSLSASSLNESAGARSQVSSLTMGALVIATLLFLAPVFSHLPKAVLGAVIIDAVVFGMIDLAELRRLYRVTRFDFWIAVAAIVGVLSVGVLAGVVVGVVLSLGWLIYVSTRPPMSAETFPGVTVLRLDGGLFFATAEALEERVRALPDDGRHALVLDFAGVNFVDSQGAAKVGEIHELTAADGVALHLAGARPQVLAVLEADGIVERIGPGTSTPTSTRRSRTQPAGGVPGRSAAAVGGQPRVPRCRLPWRLGRGVLRPDLRYGLGRGRPSPGRLWRRARLGVRTRCAERGPRIAFCAARARCEGDGPFTCAAGAAEDDREWRLLQGQGGAAPGCPVARRRPRRCATGGRPRRAATRTARHQRRRLVGVVRRALLQERGDRLGRRDAERGHDLLAVLVLDRRAQRRDLERRPHALLGQADAPGRPGRDLLGRLDRVTEQRVAGVDRRDQPDPLGLLGGHAPGGQHQLVGARGADQPRQQPARAHVAVGDADVQEHRAEDGAVRGVADVAAEREREPEAGRRPVDGGDHGLRRLAQLQHEPRHVLLAAEPVARVVGAVVARRLAVAVQVEADAERPPGAGHDDGAARAVGGDPVELLVQRAAELGVHRVEGVGAVEREDADGFGGAFNSKHCAILTGGGWRVAGGGVRVQPSACL